MNGTITRIDARKKGNGAEFKRVYFEMADGGWAKTDLCPSYRNWNRWKELLDVGNELTNLKLKTNSTVDADSYPKKVWKPKAPEQQQFKL